MYRDGKLRFEDGQYRVTFCLGILTEFLLADFHGQLQSTKWKLRCPIQVS